MILHAFGKESKMVTLGELFRKNLEKLLGKEIRVPNSVFLAMDYHLDWIEVALERTSNPEISLKKPFKRPSSNINKTQQDIDLLVAFVNGQGITELVLIEAKAFTGWNNEQLRSKVARLKEIFGDGNGSKYTDIVRPWFVLMSPKESNRIEHKSWPMWMKEDDEPRWLYYDLRNREKITRCEKDGTWSETGEYLVINLVTKSDRTSK